MSLVRARSARSASPINPKTYHVSCVTSLLVREPSASGGEHEARVRTVTHIRRHLSSIIINHHQSSSSSHRRHTRSHRGEIGLRGTLVCVSTQNEYEPSNGRTRTN